MLSLYDKVRLPLLLVAMIISAPSVAAGDAERGKMLADTCRGCHAIESYTNVYPTYHVPRVAGQSEGYLVSALTLYRDGNRAHPTMTAQAGSLTDQDIADIAAYLSSAGPELDANAPARGEAPQAAVVCAACHGQAGISLIPTNPHLAGQHQDYLQQAISQYIKGDRKGVNAIAMQAQVSQLSEADIEAITAFYAAQKGLEVLDD